MLYCLAVMYLMGVLSEYGIDFVVDREMHSQRESLATLEYFYLLNELDRRRV